MSATAADPLPRPDRWHRPLVLFAASMVVLAVVAAVAAVIDQRQITGAGVWLKPLKFAVSGAIYTLTLAWLIGQVRRGRRVADRAGTWVVVALSIEILLIFALAAAAETSHFNISTPWHTTVWAIMAASIALVWVMTLLIAIAVVRNPGPDPARTFAARSGIILALIGLGLGFLMTLPTAGQLDDFQGIVGAHAVGVPDGGPGLPLLGWSTTGGDLRIPHFIGMHALQVIPLALVGLELLGRRFRSLSTRRARLQALTVAVAVFTATLVTVTVQALSGQSIVRPTGGILIAGALIAFGGLGALAEIVRRNARSPRPDETEELQWRHAPIPSRHSRQAPRFRRR
ncbi:hypothetical protein NQ156_12275 [Microbacterium sp. zg.Y625]|uniref:hypothetical protein n=1 Tax=Microbacterium jiangjiandongii TaxID=3049071 RepID=UPI00214B141C|nr:MULTISPECIES: hypothetical protein [unclassified Microbacterium]MCR2793841.1 hypothetical protein [Microbacterium sp. zg.Y625]WIM26181.1 hypothetical protein QNO14_03755 [Microbacterium sp. zg-Y625]